MNYASIFAGIKRTIAALLPNLAYPTDKSCHTWLSPVTALGLAHTAVAVDWPQELEGKEGTVVIYQPQVDAIEGNQFKARAAMSIEMKSGGDPIFGAMWMTADIETDRDKDIARISNLRVERATWPDSKDTGEQRFTRFVEDAVAGSMIDTSLSLITASLAASEKAEQSLQELNNEPPKIVFRQELAILLLYDGKPRFSEIENSPYERALNTPLAVVKDGRRYYYPRPPTWGFHVGYNPWTGWPIPRRPGRT